MIRGREKRITNIYKSFVGSNRTDGRKDSIPYMVYTL